MDEAELSPFFRFGQTRVDSLTTKVGADDDAKLLDLIDNERGKWAFIREFGAEFRYYDASMDEKHDEKGLLMPIFQFEIGVRRDERFNAAGAFVGLRSPEDRWFIRSSVNIRELLDRRVGGEPSKALAIRFSVQREWAKHADSIPSGTTILIEATADLLKLIKPTSTAP